MATMADDTGMPDQPSAPDLPMSMTASMVLTSLPKDASQALKEVDSIDDFKGRKSTLPLSLELRCEAYKKRSILLIHDLILRTLVPVRFSALPSAPALGKQRVFKISASQRFETVVNFLRKKLGIRENETLFCYVNSVFAPGLDEGVGNLFRV